VGGDRQTVRGGDEVITLASLFDGIGGAPLCATLCGAEPVWASEIEKFPIAVTKFHFPNMKHYGDICKINGASVEPVDIFVNGSPCQDMSVAGKRQGMKHSELGDDTATRSGLFMEVIRIIKEAHKKHGTNKPRFMVWENVPGALSSNDGEDFRAVLEETARIADPTISIPRSVNGWANAGSILGNNFSISWRTIDAQYWGGVWPGTRPTPQRRRRIYLVADFGGQSAPKILFEREGCGGNNQTIFSRKLRGRGRTIVGCLSTRTGAYDRQELDTLVYEYDKQKVRLLTPLEQERLQGYPDGWTNIPGASDSARYKALGNSFAIPCALFVIGGCVGKLQEAT